MITKLYSDIVEGTYIDFVVPKQGEPELRVVVAHAPFSKLTMRLTLDDVDRLLAVREHAVNPVADIAEFFRDVFFAQERASQRAARAFVDSAGSLAETVYGAGN